MMQITSAYRDDAESIFLITNGISADCPLGQIGSLQKRELDSGVFDEFLAVGYKSSRNSPSYLSEIGRKISFEQNHFEKIVFQIDSQIEFVVKSRTTQKLCDFFPGYNSTGILNCFDGQPSGFIILIRAYISKTNIPISLLKKGSMGSSTILQLYNEYGEKTLCSFEESELTPVIDDGTFLYIKDELIHCLKTENALIGVYENDSDGRRLLDEKRRIYNDNYTNYALSKREFNPEDDEDYSQIDYAKIYDEILRIEPSLNQFVKQIQKIKPPQWGEAQNLIARIKSGDTKAKKRLIEMNMRMVLRQSLFFSKRYNLPLDEVIEDGMVGLTIAANRFIENKDDESFSSYSQLWVRQTIGRRMPSYEPIFYFPIHAYHKYLTIKDFLSNNNLDIEHNYADCIRKISSNSKCLEQLSPEALKVFLTCLIPPLRLDDFIDSENETYEVDLSIIPTVNPIEDTDYEIDITILKQVINSVLSGLSESESDVLIKRFGLNDNRCLTLEEIGTIKNVTRERVRQIESKAIKKINMPANIKKFNGFIDVTKALDNYYENLELIKAQRLHQNQDQ